MRELRILAKSFKNVKCRNSYLGKFGNSIMNLTCSQLFLNDFAYF